jgi:hypothetical protein
LCNIPWSNVNGFWNADTMTNGRISIDDAMWKRERRERWNL